MLESIAQSILVSFLFVAMILLVVWGFDSWQQKAMEEEFEAEEARQNGEENEVRS